MKQTIRLTESELKHIIKESVKKVLDEESYDETVFNPDDEYDKQLCDWLLKKYFPLRGSESFEECVKNVMENIEEYGITIRSDKGENCGDDLTDAVFQELCRDFPTVMTEYDRYYGACEWAASLFMGIINNEAEKRIGNKSNTTK